MKVTLLVGLALVLLGCHFDEDTSTGESLHSSTSDFSGLSRPAGQVIQAQEDDLFEVTMPSSAPGAELPVAAIYTEDHGLAPSTFGPQIVIAVWSNGRVVWSSNLRKGGPPYRESEIAPATVQWTLDELEATGVFRDPARSHWRFGPDAGYTVLAISDGARRLSMASWHELFTGPTTVVTDSGIESLGDRDRVQVFAGASKDYLRFRRLWNEVRGALTALIPDDGKATGALQFKQMRVPAQR